MLNAVVSKSVIAVHKLKPQVLAEAVGVYGEVIEVSLWAGRSDRDKDEGKTEDEETLCVTLCIEALHARSLLFADNEINDCDFHITRKYLKDFLSSNYGVNRKWIWSNLNRWCKGNLEIITLVEGDSNVEFPVGCY